MGFLLFILSFILVVAFSPIGLLISLFKYRNDYYFRLAISLDQFRNVVMSHLFNFILINSDKHQFGNPDETISSVLGKNKKNNSLAYLGRRLDALLNGLDENHSIKSIEK